MPRLEPCTSQYSICVPYENLTQGCAECSRDPCEIGSEPGASKKLQLNPLILSLCPSLPGSRDFAGTAVMGIPNPLPRSHCPSCNPVRVVQGQSWWMD